MGSDGTFNSGDFILFYAQGPVHWTYNSTDEMFLHDKNIYSDYAYYFITTDVGSGKRITDAQAVTGNLDFQINSYDEYQFREKDSINLIKSGQLWCWTHFSIELNWGFSFSMPNRITDAPVKMVSHLLSRSSRTSDNSRFLLVVDDEIKNTISLPGVNTSNYEALFASKSRNETIFTPSGGDFRLNLQYAPSNPAAEGWLDYLTLNTRSRLRYSGQQMNFRDVESLGEGNIGQFNIQTNGENIKVWEVTDIHNVKSLPLSGSGNNKSFIAQTDKIREYVSFNPLSQNIPIPEFEGEEGLGLIENQNLHGEQSPDMIIIVHNDLLEYAQDLADFHKEHDDLESLIRLSVVPDTAESTTIFSL